MVPDVLGRLASANSNLLEDLNYSKLDILFVYTAILIELNPRLLQRIVKRYKKDKWWKKILAQVLANNNLGKNKAVILFKIGLALPNTLDSYFFPRPKSLFQFPQTFPMPIAKGNSPIYKADNTLMVFTLVKNQNIGIDGCFQSDLLFHINRVIETDRFCIPDPVASKVIAITYCQYAHPGYNRCYEIIF